MKTLKSIMYIVQFTINAIVSNVMQSIYPSHNLEPLLLYP